MRPLFRALTAGFLLLLLFGFRAVHAATLDSALISAAQRGNAVAVRSLLARGASPNAVNTQGNTLTALMLASRGGHSEVVKLLLDAGAKVDATAAVQVGATGFNDGITALALAAASGDIATVQLLLAHHADPNAAINSKTTDDAGTEILLSRQPLIMNSANAAVLKLLAEHGADLRAKDKDGNSVLAFAAVHLDVVAIHYLLTKGADPLQKNEQGLTCVDLAKAAGKPENAAALQTR